MNNEHHEFSCDPELPSNEENDKVHIQFRQGLFPFQLPRHTPLTSGPTSSIRIPWGVQRILAPKAWNMSQGKNVQVGIVDTGADYSHPDLQNSLGHGCNLIRRQDQPHDDNGHGTHICGTIAASALKTGIRGVAPRATLHPVKAFDKQGSAYVTDIVRAIEWCTDHKMDIINMSFGMRTRSQALLDAMRKAYEQGIVIICSSGNEGRRTAIDYPARFKNAIAVGALNKKRGIASFSNRGPQVDLYAPGDQIYSTWINKQYAILNGTSMATSHATGIAALLLSMNPDLTPLQIKNILRRTSLPVISKSGKKLPLKSVHAYRAVRSLRPAKRKPKHSGKHSSNQASSTRKRNRKR